jgi:hypothetical protein
MRPGFHRRSVVLSGLLCAVAAYAIAAPAGDAISAADAVRIAERFVVLNGYTDLPAADDLAQLTPESLELRGDRSWWLEERRNTLERSAYGYWRGRRGSRPGWTVVFRYVDAPPEYRDVGRAVTMDPDGTHVRVEHIDALLKAVEKKL